MAVTITKKLTSTSSKAAAVKKSRTGDVYGAPAQHAQASRKGKRAWRKNVDIAEVEEGLEQVREEIRTTGGPLHEKSDKDLFMVDVTGNENVRKRLGKPLKSLEILRLRSAVPPVFSRPAKSATNQRLSRRAKDELRRKAGMHQLFADPTRIEVTEAVRHAGEYDVWDEVPRDEALEGLTEEGRDFIGNVVRKKEAKRPKHENIPDTIVVPAIAPPHAGQSYNPTMETHHALLLQEHEKEAAKAALHAKDLEVKRQQERVRALRVAEGRLVGAPGMLVDGADEAPDAEEEQEQGEEQEVVVVKSTVPKRKTKQQRTRAAKHAAEERALQQQKARKRLLASLSTLPSLQKSLAARQALADQRAEERKALRLQALKAGLGGRKLGKHFVPEPRVEVQLGEELAETLREMRPEGNLFRERWESLQQRARVEPRLPITARQKKLKSKTYERHYYKRFV
ncbi:P60-like protein [Calocera viscosa TUFC12733]|uniref:Ribosome biogenesis protein NOP53 n=1 Tax=Calocera viscosa (strain TUFC12733) TaxID=1330018 RepID=A0A167KLC0_CALVF|nr:P60-like protein [Calocera viscosa TUFC12733]